MPGNVEPLEIEISTAISDSEFEYDDHDHDHDHPRDDDDMMGDHAARSDGADGKRKTNNDPNRPRRKKARRACFACQRAHLTCGDERPCLRCVKRGLGSSCQDGVRKKAKYLHDAPPEALGPVLGPNFNISSVPSRPANRHRQPSNAESDESPTVNSFFTPSTAPPFPIFSAPPPMAPIPDVLVGFGSQQSPLAPTFQTGATGSQMGVLNALPGMPPVNDMAALSSAMFDPNNPNPLFNFNMDGINFSNQYGALEWGILGHMSSGAAATPSQEGPSMSQGQGSGDMGFNSPGGYNHEMASQAAEVYDNPDMMGDFHDMDQNKQQQQQQPLHSHSHNRNVNSGLLYAQGNLSNLQHSLPNAYAIAAGPQNVHSPSTDNDSPQQTYGYENSPTTTNFPLSPGPTAHSRPKQKTLGPHAILGKRQRDPSYIYDTIKQPFGYVNSFHKLIHLLQNKLSPTNTQRVAKALASIRPSFISCTRTLNTQDLVFMEKSFQRALLEYEDFMDRCPSPAIVCRRTGEVAGVNKEFTAVTGWTKDILLGKEANLNVNKAGNAGPRGPGLMTPRLLSASPDLEGPQPLFLAELMDDESVVGFYDDYARLAFGDVRGKPLETCRLLKYRTQYSQDSSLAGSNAGSEESPKKNPRSSILSSRVAKIDGEHGISRLEKDGKIDCAYTWTIKRDTFDIPMLIVINFLPRTNSHLAV